MITLPLQVRVTTLTQPTATLSTPSAALEEGAPNPGQSTFTAAPLPQAPRASVASVAMRSDEPSAESLIGTQPLAAIGLLLAVLAVGNKGLDLLNGGSKHQASGNPFHYLGT